MIHTIDTHYLGYPEFAAVYALQSQGEWTIVDTNTRFAIPRVVDALKKLGASPTSVRYIVVTHVHLDHSGGTAELLGLCPNATVLAHPRALKHLTDPSKLVESAQRVYGADQFSQLYGQIVPIASHRIRTVEDEERVDFGSSRLRFLHTLGHAKHHVCCVWEETGEIFTGDAFGLRYPALSGGGDFVFASSSPVDFDGPAALAVADRIRKLVPRAVYPTHYGKISDAVAACRDLKISIQNSIEISQVAFAEGLRGPALVQRLSADLHAWMESELRDRGVKLTSEQWKLLGLDIDLNAQGLAFAVERR